ncbi:MAG TPA: hypothetical protein VIW92_14675 [Thermoanaerobaculia bacterium]
MSSRIAALTLALSLGALPLASAETLGARRDSGIRQALSARSLVEALAGFLLPVKHHVPGNNPGNGTSEAKPEGSGACPDGKPKPGAKPSQP